MRARDAAIDGEIEAMPEIQALRAPLNAMHTHILNKQATGVKQDDPDLVNMKNEYRRAEQQLNDRRSKIRAQIETKYPIPKEVRAILDSATTTEQNVRQFADRYAQQLRHEEQVVMNVMRDANLARLRRREEADDIDTLLEVRKQLKRRLLLVELGDVDLTGQDGVAPSEAARLRQEVEELRAELKRLREAKKPE